MCPYLHMAECEQVFIEGSDARLFEAQNTHIYSAAFYGPNLLKRSNIYQADAEAIVEIKSKSIPNSFKRTENVFE